MPKNKNVITIVKTNASPNIHLDISSLVCVQQNNDVVVMKFFGEDDNLKTVKIHSETVQQAKTTTNYIVKSLDALREHERFKNFEKYSVLNSEKLFSEFVKNVDRKIDATMKKMATDITTNTEKVLNEEINKTFTKTDAFVSTMLTTLTKSLDEVGEKLFSIQKSFKNFKLFK